jgi:hypothetical protein
VSQKKYQKETKSEGGSVWRLDGRGREERRRMQMAAEVEGEQDSGVVTVSAAECTPPKWFRRTTKSLTYTYFSIYFVCFSSLYNYTPLDIAKSAS